MFSFQVPSDTKIVEKLAACSSDEKNAAAESILYCEETKIHAAKEDIVQAIQKHLNTTANTTLYLANWLNKNAFLVEVCGDLHSLRHIWHVDYILIPVYHSLGHPVSRRHDEAKSNITNSC